MVKSSLRWPGLVAASFGVLSAACAPAGQVNDPGADGRGQLELALNDSAFPPGQPVSGPGGYDYSHASFTKTQINFGFFQSYVRDMGEWSDGTLVEPIENAGDLGL